MLPTLDIVLINKASRQVQSTESASIDWFRYVTVAVNWLARIFSTWPTPGFFDYKLYVSKSSLSS